MGGLLEEVWGGHAIEGGAGGEVAPMVGEVYAVAVSKQKGGSEGGLGTRCEKGVGTILVEGVGSGTADVLIEVVHIGEPWTEGHGQRVERKPAMEHPPVEEVLHGAFGIQPHEVTEAGGGVAQGAVVADIEEIVDGGSEPEPPMV